MFQAKLNKLTKWWKRLNLFNENGYVSEIFILWLSVFLNIKYFARVKKEQALNVTTWPLYIFKRENQPVFAGTYRILNKIWATLALLRSPEDNYQASVNLEPKGFCMAFESRKSAK